MAKQPDDDPTTPLDVLLIDGVRIVKQTNESGSLNGQRFVSWYATDGSHYTSAWGSVRAAMAAWRRGYTTRRGRAQ